MKYLKKILRCESAAAKAGSPFFRDPRFLFLFTLVAIAMDSCSLYSTFDTAFGDKVVLTLLLTGGISMILNVLPSVAGYVATSHYSLKYKITLCTVILLTFSVLFYQTFQLKMSSAPVDYYMQEQDTGLETNSQYLPSNLEDITEAVDPELQAAQEQMRHLANVLVGLEPLMTSIACFILSCMQNTGAQKYTLLKKQEILLMRIAMHIETRMQPMERASAIGVMERAEDTAFATANKMVAHRCDHLRRKGEIELARWLGSASALTHTTRIKS